MRLRSFWAWFGGAGNESNEMLTKFGKDAKQGIDIGQFYEEPLREKPFQHGKGIGTIGFV